MAKAETDDLATVTDRGNENLVRRLAALMGRRMFQAVGLLFILAILFRFFDTISYVILIAFTGAIIGMAFNSVVVRLPVSRGVGTAIVALVTLAALGLGFWFVVTFVANQLQQFIADLPQLAEQMQAWEQWLQDSIGIEIGLMGPTIQDTMGRVLGDVDGMAVLGGALGFLELFAICLLILMGSFFVVAKPNDLLLTPLMRAVPRERRPAYRRMFDRIGERLTGWLVGTLVSMLVVGILSTVAFIVIGVPYSILLGALNGLLNIIPLIGAWVGGLAAVMVTLFVDPSRVLFVIVAVVAIQELEGNLIRPLVMAGSARLHPFVVLLSLLLFTSIFGILGAILSLPITLAIITIVEVLWVEETLHAGDDEIEPVVKE